MKIYLLNIKYCKFDYDSLFNELDDNTKKIINSLNKEEDKKIKLIKEILIKRYTENDERIKEKCYFDIVHSRDIIALIKDENIDVGIDVEFIDENITLRPYENKINLDTSKIDFYTYRTRKEALAKCFGINLYEDNKLSNKKNNWHKCLGIPVVIESLKLNDYMLSFAYKSKNKIYYDMEVIKSI